MADISDFLLPSWLLSLFISAAGVRLPVFAAAVPKIGLGSDDGNFLALDVIVNSYDVELVSWHAHDIVVL